MPGSLDDITWPLRTERLSIRPATAEDAEATWVFRSQEEVCRWLPAYPTEYDAYRTRFIDEGRLARTYVVEHETRVIGDVMIMVTDAWAQSEVADRAKGMQAELGWCLDPAYGGRGLATEAVAELIRCSFEDLAFIASTPSASPTTRPRGG